MRVDGASGRRSHSRALDRRAGARTGGPSVRAHGPVRVARLSEVVGHAAYTPAEARVLAVDLSGGESGRGWVTAIDGPVLMYRADHHRQNGDGDGEHGKRDENP